MKPSRVRDDEYNVVDNVWEKLASSPQEAEALRLRAQIMIVIREMLQERGLNQHQAAELFGVTQPRVSKLVRGKAREFSLDALMGFLSCLGWRLQVGYHDDELDVAASRHAA